MTLCRSGGRRAGLNALSEESQKNSVACACSAQEKGAFVLEENGPAFARGCCFVSGSAS